MSRQRNTLRSKARVPAGTIIRSVGLSRAIRRRRVFHDGWGTKKVRRKFGATSDEAFVASAQASCLTCHERIEVICIYCESGTDSEIGDPMTQVTVSSVWAMDKA